MEGIIEERYYRGGSNRLLKLVFVWLVFCCAWPLLLHKFSSCISWGHSFVVVCGFLFPVASLAKPSTGSRYVGFSSVVHGLGCSVVCGISPNQGLNRVFCVSRRILNHWTIREVSESWFKSIYVFLLFLLYITMQLSFS